MYALSCVSSARYPVALLQGQVSISRSCSTFSMGNAHWPMFLTLLYIGLNIEYAVFAAYLSAV